MVTKSSVKPQWFFFTHLDLLKEKGADPRRRTHAHQTLLHTAVRAGHAAAAQWAVGLGVELFARDDDRRTAFDCAVDFRQAECLEVLLAEAERVRTMGQNQVNLRHQKFTFPRARE